MPEQLILPYGRVRNRELFSSHWLENRLPLEPEWAEAFGLASTIIEQLSDIWRVQRDRVEHYGAENPLEHAFIQPVLSVLGWHVFYQTHLQGRGPDYALFDSDESLELAIRAGRTSPEFWRFPILVADAKAWHVNLDRPHVVNNRREYPPDQIEWYLDRSRLSYGLLTNGQLWRLIPRERESDQPRFQTHLECDLAALLTEWATEDNLVTRDRILQEFAVFLAFFSPLGFRIQEDRRSLLERARKGSSEYRLGIGKDLKARVFEALRLCVDGFLQHPANRLNQDALAICRSESFTFLYRLLFVLYAEDRGLLPYRRNRLYTENRSLGRIRQDIANRLDQVAALRGGTQQVDFSNESTGIWTDLQTLFDLVDRGHARYQVPQYNGGLFDDAEHQFLRDKVVGDWHLARVIDQLSRALDAEHPDRGLFSVDYRDLRIQHLGSIYEGLLELHPCIAPQLMTDPVSFQLVAAGHVFLQHEKAERRNTGSYYTPNHIVDYIVQRTLAPLCKQIDEGLRAEIAAASAELHTVMGTDREPEVQANLERLYGEFDDRVLRLRVLDPAMGSGHFLLSACQYLAEEIATHPYSADPAVNPDVGDESSVSFWKRRVVEHCLFGVDRNPLAVELAKLALWLETVAIDRPLTFLDHHLRVGNSLVGADLQWLETLPGGRPLLQMAYRGQVQSSLSSFLEPLHTIGSMGSDTADRVKQKSALLRQANDRIRPFAAVADLWSATFYLQREQRPTDEQYAASLQELSRPVRFARLIEEPWFRAARAVAGDSVNSFFHWELEFPEVFFTNGGYRGDAGFDAVIGNPPYDVLSELETGQRLDSFKKYIDVVEAYRPSIRGKNNLYKLFLCRALSLLAQGGYLGFITPMPLLGDDQAAAVRKEIFKIGAFRSVDAFPQKDDVARRVFPEAKLSTVVFTVEKTAEPEVRDQRFVARVHPANQIEESSPGLLLSTSEIPLYDPENLTVVSCDQRDWDLAVRIMRTGRLQRLGNVCVSYQGEVNETNEGPRGSLSKDRRDGVLVLRGANVCMYAIREASQGEPLYLKLEPFLAGKDADSKAFAFREARIGFQRSSPQNNFRRIVAAGIPAGKFCFDTVSYVPVSQTKVAPGVLIALLNSKLLDWYFRLGSTNSKVNEYQFNNLPCPVFSTDRREIDAVLANRVVRHIDEAQLDAAFDELATHALGTPPFPQGVADVLAVLVSRIEEYERQRGEISRRERARLADPAQPLQNLIDRILFALAGLTAEESAQLEMRLATML